MFAIVLIISETIKVAIKRSSDKPESVVNPKELSEQEIDKILRDVAEETASQLPMRVDSNTEVVQMTYLQGQIHTGFRLLNQNASEIDKNTFIRQIKPTLMKSVCTEPDYQIIRKREMYSIHYKYYDKDREHMATIVVDENDCK